MLPCIKTLVTFLGMNLLIYKKLAKIGGFFQTYGHRTPSCYRPAFNGYGLYNGHGILHDTGHSLLSVIWIYAYASNVTRYYSLVVLWCMTVWLRCRDFSLYGFWPWYSYTGIMLNILIKQEL